MPDVTVRCFVLCYVLAKLGQLGHADATVWYSVVHVSCSDCTALHIPPSSVTTNLWSELFWAFYVAYNRSFVPTFRDNPSATSSRVKQSKKNLLWLLWSHLH